MQNQDTASTSTLVVTKNESDPSSNSSITVNAPVGSSAGNYVLTISKTDSLSSVTSLATVSVTVQLPSTTDVTTITTTTTGESNVCDENSIYLTADTSSSTQLPEDIIQLEMGDEAQTYTLPSFIIQSTGSQVDLNALCGPVSYALKVTDSAGDQLTPSFASYIQGSNKLTINLLENDSEGEYNFELVGSLSSNTAVNKTIQLFDLVVNTAEVNTTSNETLAESETQQNITEITLPKESEGTQNETQSQEVNVTETASADKDDDEEETVKQSPSFKQEPGIEIDFKFRLTPNYKTPIIPDVPEIGERQYAGCRISDITTLGLMTLKMNETVIIHDDYSDLTLQDFDVVFQQNS